MLIHSMDVANSRLYRFFNICCHACMHALSRSAAEELTRVIIGSPDIIVIIHYASTRVRSWARYFDLLSLSGDEVRWNSCRPKGLSKSEWQEACCSAVTYLKSIVWPQQRRASLTCRSANIKAVNVIIRANFCQSASCDSITLLSTLIDFVSSFNWSSIL